METYEPDMLDDVAAHRAETQPEVAHEWAATKIVVQLRKAREDRGLPRAEVAARMGLAEARVAEIERRSWAVGFARILAYASALGIELVLREEGLSPVEKTPVAA